MRKSRFQYAALLTMAIIAAAFLVLTPTLGHSAQKPANSSTQVRCSGTNMLPELAAQSPEEYSKIRAAAQATPNTQAVLWKIEREGVPPSYLLGTIHLTDSRVTTYSPNLKAALEETKTLVLEVADMSNEATNAAINNAAGSIIFTDGRKLNELLSDVEYDQVKATLSSAGLPNEMASVIKPWVVSMLLSASACERQQASNGVPVLDLKLANTARDQNIKVVGLETIDSQFAAMAAISDDQQIAMLRANLKFADRADDTTETLLQLYLSRNMGSAWAFQLALAKEAGVDSQSFSEFQKHIISDRNREMRDASLPLLRDGHILIAVGALHLIGDHGLVALLRQSGYTLTPIE